jgi:hypothetical protein
MSRLLMLGNPQMYRATHWVALYIRNYGSAAGCAMLP